MAELPAASTPVGYHPMMYYPPAMGYPPAREYLATMGYTPAREYLATVGAPPPVVTPDTPMRATPVVPSPKKTPINDGEMYIPTPMVDGVVRGVIFLVAHGKQRTVVIPPGLNADGVQKYINTLSPHVWGMDVNLRRESIYGTVYITAHNVLVPCVLPPQCTRDVAMAHIKNESARILGETDAHVISRHMEEGQVKHMRDVQERQVRTQQTGNMRMELAQRWDEYDIQTAKLYAKQVAVYKSQLDVASLQTQVDQNVRRIATDQENIDNTKIALAHERQCLIAAGRKQPTKVSRA